MERSRREPVSGGFEVALVALGAVLVGSAGIVWGGARLAALATGGRLRAGLGDALRAAGRLASRPGEPAAAWGELATGLPGPVVYWAMHDRRGDSRRRDAGGALVAVASLVVASGIAVRGSGRRPGGPAA